MSQKETETRSRGPASVWLTERMSANTWSNATTTRHCGFIHTFSRYYSWEYWHLAAPDAHISPTYLHKSLELLFACKEQSFSLYHGLISIKPHCWQVSYAQFCLTQALPAAGRMGYHFPPVIIPYLPCEILINVQEESLSTMWFINIYIGLFKCTCSRKHLSHSPIHIYIHAPEALLLRAIRSSVSDFLWLISLVSQHLLIINSGERVRWIGALQCEKEWTQAARSCCLGGRGFPRLW